MAGSFPARTQAQRVPLVVTLRSGITSVVVRSFGREEVLADGVARYAFIWANTDGWSTTLNSTAIFFLKNTHCSGGCSRVFPSGLAGDCATGREGAVDHLTQPVVVLVGKIGQRGFEVAMSEPSLDGADGNPFRLSLLA